MILSEEQSEAVAAVKTWWKSKRQVFELSGAAGTGKTTLAKFITSELGLKDSEVVYCAFTGKAALVLAQKGCKPSSTVHSLIYKAKQDEHTGDWNFDLDKAGLKAAGIKLVILDEAPMLGEDVALDLASCGVKILALGDKWQLPPVNAKAYFGLGEPNFLLTEIHRQAADNPIITLATLARNGGILKPGSYGESRVIKAKKFADKDILESDIVLCGKNETRHYLNGLYRQVAGTAEFGVEPQIGERLICLRNNRGKGFLNGQMFRVVSQVSDGQDVRCEVLPEDIPETLPSVISTPIQYFKGEESKLDWRVRANCDEFGFGWAISVHKSQGSQFDHVMIFDQSKAFREHARNHLYTAITRAKDKVTIYID